MENHTVENTAGEIMPLFDEEKKKLLASLTNRLEILLHEKGKLEEQMSSKNTQIAVVEKEISRLNSLELDKFVF